MVSNDGVAKKIAVIDSNGEIRFSTKNDILGQHYYAAGEIIKNDGIKHVSSEIKINNAYYLNGESIQGDGVAIYYETNVGTYVYYARIGEEYVISLDRFAEMMKEVDSKRGPDNLPGADISVSALFDMSEFNIKSESFNVKANPLSDNNVILNLAADSETTKFPVKQIVCGVAVCVCPLFAVLVAVRTVKSKRINTK